MHGSGRQGTNMTGSSLRGIKDSLLGWMRTCDSGSGCFPRTWALEMGFVLLILFMASLGHHDFSVVRIVL